MSWRLRIVAVTACAVIVAAGWSTFRHFNRGAPPHVETRQDREVRWEGIRQQWRSMPFLDLDSAGVREIEEAIGSTLAAPLAPLDGALREALIATLSTQLDLRASGVVDAYLDHAATDPTTRWIVPDDDMWRRYTNWHTHWHGGAPDPDGDRREHLRLLIEHMLTNDHARLTGLGTGPGGMRAAVFRVRTTDQVDFEVLRDLPPEVVSYWFENEGAFALFLRVPMRSLAAIIEMHGSALVCDVCTLVRREDGKIYNLHTTWYWDPDARAWLCHRMARKGWDGFLWF